MKINESFRSAADKYGEEFARQMLNAGIPDRYVLSACRFHCNPPNKPIDVLSIQFRQWMTYVTPYNKIDVNCLSYDDFTKLINEKMTEWICPNKLYDDGNVSVGVFLTKKDAEKYPLKTMAGNDFCTSNACGFNKYTKQGYRLLSIYDKGRGKDGALKYVIATVKDGIISIWNAANYPIGDTSEPYMNDAWRYLDSLPDEAQKIILEFAKQTKIKELKSNKCMKRTINESQLRAIVAESVKRVLKEGIMGRAMRNVYNDAKNGYTQGYDNFSDFAKGARDYVKNQDSDFEQERYKQYKQDYKNAPKNSEERGYYAQNALANKPGLGGRITRAASVPLQTGAYLAGRIARRFGGNSQVKEAKIYAEVLRMINEDAGHLYWHDENGKAHTNSRETWRGVEGTIYVYHGDWSDPEVLYDDEEINYWDLEESAWDSYKCECEDNGKEPSEQEFDNLPSSWFKEYLDYEYMPGRFGENY